MKDLGLMEERDKKDYRPPDMCSIQESLSMLVKRRKEPRTGFHSFQLLGLLQMDLGSSYSRAALGCGLAWSLSRD